MEEDIQYEPIFESNYANCYGFCNVFEKVLRNCCIILERGALHQCGKNYYEIHTEYFDRFEDAQVLCRNDRFYQQKRIIANHTSFSGIIINDDTLLTAYHALKEIDNAYNAFEVVVDDYIYKRIDQKEFFVHEKNRLDLQDRTVMVNENVDLAVAKLSRSNDFNTIPFCSQIDLGNEVFSIGYPFGTPSKFTTGKVGPKRNYDAYSSLPVFTGSSGSPVFNLKGQLVGINTDINYKCGLTNNCYTMQLEGYSAMSLLTKEVISDLNYLSNLRSFSKDHLTSKKASMHVSGFSPLQLQYPAQK